MKLSIIIPIYNTADYLPACLASVLESGLDDYEIILVNDGSTDNSGAVAAEYERQYPSLIRLITTENGGLGAARNVGIDAAQGDYLFFLDSDDSLEKGALREMLSALDESFDLLLFDLSEVNPSGEVIGRISGCGREGQFTLAEYPELLFQPPSGCNKLFRRGLFAESGIRFPGRVWYEDLRTSPKLYPLTANIRYMPKAWYRYLIRPGSITKSANVARNLEIIDAVEDILAYYRAQGLYERYEAELCYMACYHVLLVGSVRVNTADAESEVQEQLLRWFLNSFPDYRKNPYFRKMRGRHRLLCELLLRRRRREVHALMRVNDLLKRKKG